MAVSKSSAVSRGRALLFAFAVSWASVALPVLATEEAVSPEELVTSEQQGASAQLPAIGDGGAAGSPWPALVFDEDSSVLTAPIDALGRGQKGYGLSVFAGTEPVPFEVEVLGTWQSNTAGMTYLLTRLSGQDLERSGVLGGMSGSPVYFDGKLVGAVAFSFSFGMDPIAGITPIGEMRNLGRLSQILPGIDSPPGLEPLARSDAAAPPRPAARNGAAASLPTSVARIVPTLDALTRGELDPGLLDAFLDLLVPTRAAGDGRMAVTWSASGFGQPAREQLARRLGPLLPSASGRATLGASASPGPRSGRAAGATPGAPSASATPADLQAGDAVALVLARGDVSLAAHGTVTERRGDAIVAFGHPIYSLGPVAVPMAESEVITPVPSVSSSFKLSNVGGLIGTFDEDREAGAHGVLGEVPALTPVHIRLRGVEEREFHMELADLPMFRPTLLAMSTMGSLTTSTWASGNRSLDVHARFHLDGHDDIVVDRAFDGMQAANDMLVHLLGIAAFLEFNDIGPAPIRGFEIDIHQTAEPRLESLLGVRADRVEVSPGEKVRLQLSVRPYHQETTYRHLEVKIPEDLPAGRYYLMVGDGASMDAARLAVRRPQNQSLEQNLEALRAFSDNRELHLMGLVAARGRSMPGSVLPDLPASMRAVIGSEGEALELRITGTEVVEWEAPLEGIHRVDFLVTHPTR